MKAIVTGGGGFLGSHIVRALRERGDQVVALGRSRYPFLPREVTQVQGDIRDRAFLATVFRGADAVFHVAGRVGIWGPWEEYYETNVRGTENVLAACRTGGVPRLVYTSSPSVVFDGHDHRGVDESHPYPTEWLSPYPRSKKLAEETVLAANGMDGVHTVALRPHLIWGKGDTSLIPRVMDRARAGQLARIGDGKNRVDTIHVRNAAAAHLAAADRLGPGASCSGKAYFVSQDEPVPLWDFIGDILSRAKLPPVRKHLSFQAAYRLGGVLEKAHRLFAPGREPRMTRFLAHQLAKDHYYDIGAAKRDLGYRPHVSTSEGLDELFRTEAGPR